MTRSAEYSAIVSLAVVSVPNGFAMSASACRCSVAE
jgi:hypothetical protein